MAIWGISGHDVYCPSFAVLLEKPKAVLCKHVCNKTVLSKNQRLELIGAVHQIAHGLSITLYTIEI